MKTLHLTVDAISSSCIKTKLFLRKSNLFWKGQIKAQTSCKLDSDKIVPEFWMTNPTPNAHTYYYGP